MCTQAEPNTLKPRQTESNITCKVRLPGSRDQRAPLRVGKLAPGITSDISIISITIVLVFLFHYYYYYHSQARKRGGGLPFVWGKLAPSQQESARDEPPNLTLIRIRILIRIQLLMLVLILILLLIRIQLQLPVH